MKALTSKASVTTDRQLNRRDFLTTAARTAASAAMLGSTAWTFAAEAKFAPPVVVFSKVYQTLKLNFDDAAELTAEAGLDGVDVPVRDGGEVLPARVTEDLPRYAEALRKRGKRIQLLTSGITSVSSPHAEEVLRATKALGIRFYRFGFFEKRKDVATEKQIAEIRSQLKDLAGLNRQFGLCGVYQNHSPAGRSYVGGDLNEMAELMSGFDPAQIGIAFDLGHAIVVHGDEWSSHFEKLKSHLRVAYIKDARRDARFVPLGEGEIGRTDYFKRLRRMGYDAPISLHIEFDWSDDKKQKTRAGLLKALKESTRVLRGWLAEA